MGDETKVHLICSSFRGEGYAPCPPTSRRPTLSTVELVVRVAELVEVRPLQLEVLRPNGPLPGDRPPPSDALHVAALRDGVVIGAATVLPER